MILENKKILIRADGGSGIGMGHVMRCIALGECLVNEGIDVDFMSNGNHQELKKRKFSTIDCKSTVNSEIERRYLENHEELHSYALIIIDSYNADNNYFHMMRKYGERIAYIEDIRTQEWDVDILINGNIYASNEGYYPKGRKYLLGSSYLLIREEFQRSSRSPIRKDANTILITFGGSDPKQVTKGLLQAIKKIEDRSRYHFIVVVGNAFEDQDLLMSYQDQHIECIKAPKEMSELMQKSDVAISASGSTLYELAIMGVPSIGVIVAENQTMIAHQMNQLNVTSNLGWYYNLSPGEIISKAIEIAMNYDKRLKMRQCAQEIFEGNSTKNCADELIRRLR